MAVQKPPIRTALTLGGGITRPWQRWFQSIPNYMASSENIPHATYIFTSTATRDAYFSANPAELVENIIIALITTAPRFKFQRFDGSNWIDIDINADALKVQGVTVDDASIADGAALLYQSASGNLEYKLVLERDASNNVSVGTVTLNAGASLQDAMNGDLLLSCTPSTAGTSAATLNAAAAGTFTKTITIDLKNTAGALHTWATLTLSAAGSVTAVDTDILPPTVSDTTPDLSGGTVDVVLTYDTDGGSTKTYAAGDIVRMTVSAPASGILGYSVADATFTDTLVA